MKIFNNNKNKNNLKSLIYEELNLKKNTISDFFPEVKFVTIGY